MTIATLWIIKDRSDQHDRGAHAQERDNPSEHPRRALRTFLFIGAMTTSKFSLANRGR